MSNKQKYVIDGKLYGVFPMLFSSAVSLVFLILAVDQLRGGSGKIFTVGLMFSVGFALSLFVSIPLINRYFFFKICVGENDFSLRTTPFNEKTYKYSEVKNAKTEQKTSMRRGGVVCIYYFIQSFKSFEYTDHQYGHKKTGICDAAVHRNVGKTIISDGTE